MSISSIATPLPELICSSSHSHQQRTSTRLVRFRWLFWTQHGRLMSVAGHPWRDRVRTVAAMVGSIYFDFAWRPRGEVDRNATLVRLMSATYAVNKCSHHFILVPARFLNFEFLMGKVENEWEKRYPAKRPWWRERFTHWRIKKYTLGLRKKRQCVNVRLLPQSQCVIFFYTLAFTH
jgi:hypothetical protein